VQAIYENPSHSYGVSLAIWDHTVLPATRHKLKHPTSTPARQAGTLFTDHLRMEGWVSPGVLSYLFTVVVVCFQRCKEQCQESVSRTRRKVSADNLQWLRSRPRRQICTLLSISRHFASCEQYINIRNGARCCPLWASYD